MIAARALAAAEINQRHLMPFYLGVAIAEEGSSDARALGAERRGCWMSSLLLGVVAVVVALP